MKKLNLGGIAAVSSSTRSAHPTVDVTDAEFAALLEQFAILNPQYKTLKNQSETLGKQLSPKIKALFFSLFAGRDPESSTILVRAGGKTIKLITKNAYSKTLTDDAALVAAIGEENVSRYFRQATVLKLELDKVAEDRQEQFANGVLALAAELGATDAVSASQCIQPKAGFHEARHTILNVEQNIALDALLPITAYPQL